MARPLNDPLVLVSNEQQRDLEDPILDASFILEGAKVESLGGQTPLDVILKEKSVPLTEDSVTGARDAVRSLVERGLVPYIVMCWVRELELAGNESVQWSRWLTKMTMEGKHLRASTAVKFGAYRMQLTKTILESGQAIIKEVKSSNLDKNSKKLVQSFLPRGVVNPLEEAVKNGHQVLVNGTSPSHEELAAAFDEEPKVKVKKLPLGPPPE